MTTPPYFMTLPPEIRIMIYEFVLGDHEPIEVLPRLVDECYRDCNDFSKCSAGDSTAEAVLSLLKTSSQIQNEALPFLLRGLEFHLRGAHDCTIWTPVIFQPSLNNKNVPSAAI